ncbi:MAG: YcxB family protein [Peptococcaceae bacterium]|nr:YcxB family protein [Peptococcaceae bacterium]
MEFRFETTYDKNAFTAMARTLRKTVRKKHSRRSHILGGLVVALGLFFLFLPDENGIVFDSSAIITILAVAAIIVVFFCEDQLNGLVAMKRMLPGLEKDTAVFREDGYISENAIGKSEWQYSNIHAIAETPDYFIFIFGNNHAQLYDKWHMSGGTASEFRSFMEEKTGKNIEMLDK